MVYLPCHPNSQTAILQRQMRTGKHPNPRYPQTFTLPLRFASSVSRGWRTCIPNVCKPLNTCMKEATRMREAQPREKCSEASHLSGLGRLFPFAAIFLTNISLPLYYPESFCLGVWMVASCNPSVAVMKARGIMEIHFYVSHHVI